MRLRHWWLIAFFTIATASPVTAQSYFPGVGSNTLPNRKAFIVGVSSYLAGPWSGLPNVRNDVPAVRKALTKLGFDEDLGQYVVDDGHVTRHRIFEKLYTFMEDARNAPNSLLVFYFAGHGFTHKGNMYLAPADAPIRYAEDPDRFAIRLADIVDILQAAKPLVAIVIVDACRDLPFSQLPSIYDLNINDKVVTGGQGVLGKPNSEDDAPNVAILYSATQGFKAPDGEQGKTSYFVAALTSAIEDAVARVPSNPAKAIAVEDITNEVVLRVRDLTNDRQNPRPDIPFGYKIPLFATEAAYKAEADEWEKLQGQINIEGPKIPDWTPTKVKELVYCRVRAFRGAFGYSYFWREVTTSLRENRTPDAVNKCREKSAVAAAPLFAPSVSAVVAPSGAVNERQIRAADNAFRLPAAAGAPMPAATPPALPDNSISAERRLLLATSDEIGAKAVLLKAASFDQPDFPGGRRSINLAAGENVRFIEYAGSSKTVAKAFHETHGYGLLSTDALLILNGIVRIALAYDAGQIDFSARQQVVLDQQLRDAHVVRAASTAIRFAKVDSRIGFQRAQAIAAYLQRTPALPVDASINAFFPDIAEDNELAPGLVTISIIVETTAAAPVAPASAPAPLQAHPSNVTISTSGSLSSVIAGIEGNVRISIDKASRPRPPIRRSIFGLHVFDTPQQMQ